MHHLLRVPFSALPLDGLQHKGRQWAIELVLPYELSRFSISCIFSFSFRLSLSWLLTRRLNHTLSHSLSLSLSPMKGLIKNLYTMTLSLR
jgi:hypothetical protein